MASFTVISTTHRMGADLLLTPSPLCAIAGRAEVYGYGLHVAYPVYADTADEGIGKVREAVQILGGVVHPQELPVPVASRWTVIGTADTGVCPSWRTIAVVAGEHAVEGRWDSMLSHRWSYVVDAAGVQEAERVADNLAAGRYGDDD